jgi:SAM-dependent methyltransferase
VAYRAIASGLVLAMHSAARFFDDDGYLRTVVAEKLPARSAAEARGAARLAGCRPGALILDAGCGNGRHAVHLARAGYRVVGLDRSSVLLAAARRSSRDGPRPRFVRASYTSLPFAHGTFDAVLCLGTALGYLGEEGDRAPLREFRRVLAPAGRLVIETLHRAEIGARLAEHEERRLACGDTLRFERHFDHAHHTMRETQRLDEGTGEGPPRTYELRVYSAGELCRMLAEAGFEVVERHASLEGIGEPSPSTPLVLVAEVDGART